MRGTVRRSIRRRRMNDTVTPSQARALPLVLASASVIRRELLDAAGLSHVAEAADVDEGEVKRRLRSQGAAVDAVAEALATLKAQHVAKRHADALVIGAYQILDADGLWFDKPADVAAARRQLQTLRGRSHELVSAVSVVRGGAVAWRHVARARLTMRDFSDAFLDAYLQKAGPRALESVGAYQLEGLGVQLFDHIEGDYFVILGLPLLPLLDFLRRQGVIAT